MPLHPQSPEFARLALRWLDGSATAEEAERLWEGIGEDKALAREFAEHARFELLLQDTLREQKREQGIAAGARREATRHRGRMIQRRALAVAAVVLATGFLIWLALPNHSAKSPEVARVPVATPLKPTSARPLVKPRRATMLVARQEAPPPIIGAKMEPLRKRLDDFFLTGVDLDKVPLSQALKQLEEQLRELNFASSADLAALRVQLPAGAGAQIVTFHSGSISFLKATRALASLAGYDVEIGDATVALVAGPNDSPYHQESHSVADLLAGQGGSADLSRNRLDELLSDARSLGIQLNLANDGNVIGLKATPGEFRALALLGQARDQVRSLPPFLFYVMATPSAPGAQDRILTGTDADQARADLLRSASQQSSNAIITVPMLESVPAGASAQPGEIFVSAGPVGADRIYLNLIPGPLDFNHAEQQNINPSLAGSQDPLIAFIPRSDIIQLTTQVPSTSTSVHVVTPSVGAISLPNQTSSPGAVQVLSSGLANANVVATNNQEVLIAGGGITSAAISNAEGQTTLTLTLGATATKPDPVTPAAPP